ncbi:MAG: hypothetical protein A4E20_10780 [Nitrospira sp. SG-bin2]|nr:MAG: hypothetical protein A4E20_10780 [Nitrospira sp. SG-bin2]
MHMIRVRFGSETRPIICAYTGKHKYETQDVAQVALKRVRKERYATGKKKKECAIYYCVICENYHLTSRAS